MNSAPTEYEDGNGMIVRQTVELPMSNAQKVSDDTLQYLIDTTQHRPDYQKAFTELQSLRAAPTPDAHFEVGVKALEWVKKGNDWYAWTAVGQYGVGKIGESHSAILRFIADDQDDDKVLARNTTEVEAMAAAQADFAQRVQSCLTAGVVKAEPTGWRTMDTAPLDGKHCILSVPVDGGFIYSVQGAYRDDKWDSVIGDDVKPMYWMPNVLHPKPAALASKPEEER